ncbi:hypothetical protein ABID08_002917 [Rhizobium binae]|uniref:Uncharacterized protein n=1 Tax=Rhizobium binae TaxID=1138190 RepID=A0ABV2MGP3_9HYPH|nr:hypothetical protein [Rhizobium binae]
MEEVRLPSDHIEASSMARTWSHEAVNLFRRVMAGEEYEGVV